MATAFSQGFLSSLFDAIVHAGLKRGGRSGLGELKEWNQGQLLQRKQWNSEDCSFLEINDLEKKSDPSSLTEMRISTMKTMSIFIFIPILIHISYRAKATNRGHSQVPGIYTYLYCLPSSKRT